MSDKKKVHGAIIWQDLTVPNPGPVRDFYSAVVGWTPIAEDMGDYEDFSMALHGTQEIVAGVCHAKETNADMPAQWLIYIHVDSVPEAVAKCKELGGQVVHGPRLMGKWDFCVIQDPAGAVCALIGPERE